MKKLSDTLVVLRNELVRVETVESEFKAATDETASQLEELKKEQQGASSIIGFFFRCVKLSV